MFVLLKRIRGWRTEMVLSGAFSLAELDELGDHLRTDAEKLITDKGLGDDDAFGEALRRLGSAYELEPEFQTEHRMSGRALGTLVPSMVRLLNQFCLFLRSMVVFCLPALAVSAPVIVLGRQYQQMMDALFLKERLPTLTTVTFGLLASLDTYHVLTVWISIIALAAVIFPTAFHARQLHNSHRLSIPDLLEEELDNLRPVVLAGLICYPLLGYLLVSAAILPFTSR